MSEVSLEIKPEPNWEWYPCVFDLKKVLKNKEVFYNLSPSILLNHPNSSEEKPLDLIANCSVTMEKPFIYSEEMGWNWHKSWNIPNVNAKIEILDPATNEKFLTPSKFFAELIVTKAEFNEVQTFHLVDVGVKGNNKFQLHSNECVFSGLKFIPTSYNHEGSKFHLVVIFYLLKNNDDFHHILEAKISPPIFVDSRKTARENHKNLKIKEILSFVEPFNPEKLKKIFIKRENKKNFGFEEEIENSLHGLTHYFSAPNIRNKVKHPLFLAIKFSNIVNLYYNSKLVGNDKDEKSVIQGLQKHLVDTYLAQKPKKSITKDKFLLVHVEDIYKGNYAENKKTLDFFDLIETESLQVISDHKNIPAHFLKLKASESLIIAYEKIYPKLRSDKQLKGTIELLNSKGSLKDSFEESESEEEKKDQEESSDTLLKMEDDGLNLSQSKKSRKRLKGLKEPSETVNLAGPIKVEIDITPEMAARLNKSLQPQKVKLESLPAAVAVKSEERRPPLQVQPKIEPPAPQNPSPVTAPMPMPYSFMNPGLLGQPPPMDMGQSGVLHNPQYLQAMKAMQFYGMGFGNMGMIENPFSNPFLYQECLKAYMENMQKMYEGGSAISKK